VAHIFTVICYEFLTQYIYLCYVYLHINVCIQLLYHKVKFGTIKMNKDPLNSLEKMSFQLTPKCVLTVMGGLLKF